MGAKYISINAGEPFLRNDIELIVNKIRERDMLCHLVTNGLLIKENIAVLKKIDSLSISIDGTKESNDLNRGEGVYDRIIEAFECLNENHIRFHTHTVLTKNNKNAVDEIISLAYKFGFKAQFSILRIQNYWDKTINLNDAELREIISNIVNYKKSGFPIFFSCAAYRNVLDWPFSFHRQTLSNPEPIGYKAAQRYIKRFSGHIEAEGLVYPCVILVNNFKAMNFLEVGFKKTWENLANSDCIGCYNICCNDLNLIFGLRLSSSWNAFKIVMNRITHMVK